MVRARLQDVAAAAGVSEATVSRVVNDRPGVAASTRQQVLQAMRTLGYEPAGVQHTRGGGIVGLVVPELDNPVFPVTAQAIEQRLAGAGYLTLLTTSSRSSVHEQRAVDVLLEQHVRGLVFVQGQHADTEADHSRYRALVRDEVPFACLGGSVPGIGAPCFATDEARAVGDAVQHLRHLGHRRIAIALGPLGHVASQRKLAGWAAAMGADVDHTLHIETTYSFPGGRLAGRRAIDNGATAVVAGSDIMALGIVAEAIDLGRTVPGGLSVVGYDDAGMGAWVQPALTSLRQPIPALADLVVDALVARFEGRPVATDEVLLRADLIVRRSTAPPASASG